MLSSFSAVLTFIWLHKIQRPVPVAFYTLMPISFCVHFGCPGDRAQQRPRGPDGHPGPDDARGSQQPPVHHQRLGESSN